METSSEAIVVKSGETCIQTSLTRGGRDGLLVNVWAQPKVEDFMRSLGTGEIFDVKTIGRHWTAHKDPTKKLMVYDFSKDVGPLRVDEHLSYYLHRPGYSVVDMDYDPEADRGRDDGRRISARSESLNLSFLRLVGISEPGGVSFTVGDVVTRSAADRLSAKIQMASARFYREFLKPFKLIVTVSTMSVPESL